MDRILLMCEGQNEKCLIDLLIEDGILKITRDDLIGGVPYLARQIRQSVMIKNQLNIYHGNFKIIRIGDTQKDELKIPKEYQKRITSIKKICTKPELELLMIIAEGKIDDFNKLRLKPKEFAKQFISVDKTRYDNSSGFYKLYYYRNKDKLIKAIKEYKRIKRHEKDELFLADLIK